MQPKDTHVARLGGEEVFCNEVNYQEKIEELMARHPDAGVPKVERLVEVDYETNPPSKHSTKNESSSRDASFSEEGRLRVMSQMAVAEQSGFAPASPMYSVGTRVNATGVENAHRSQLEHDAKPIAREAALALAERVKTEERTDTRPFSIDSLVLHQDGYLQTPEGRYYVTREGFRKLVSRLIPARSAGAYLEDCPPSLRSMNWETWRSIQSNSPGIIETAVLRTRKGLNTDGREVFSAVSQKYTPYDADLVGEALALAFPDDARGSVDYDGQKYRVEGLWHTNVAANEFVAGEFFKAGVLVSGDDTGSGSIRVQSVIWRNLCLNLIILDKSIGVDIRIRHIGDVRKLALQFRRAFERALLSVEGFRRAWGAAIDEQGRALTSRVQGTTSDDLTALPAAAVLAGIFNGLVKRDLVPIRGRADDVVPKLLEMHWKEPAVEQLGVSRASVVNAITRYAHEVELDPFRADAIRAAAGSLLTGHRRNGTPAPLPFESFNG